MAITQYTSISSFIASIYEDAVLVAREGGLMPSLVSGYSAQGRMTRAFSTRPEVSYETVADAVDYSNPTTFGKSSVGTLTPGEVIAQFILTDANIESDPDNARAQAAQELGEAAAKKVDTDLVGVFSSFTTDTGTANSAFSTTIMADAISRLRAAFAPSGALRAVLHPYHWHDLWLELGKPAATLAALGDVTTQALRDYYVGTLLGGVRIFTSSNITVDTGVDAISGIFTQPAIMLDTRRQMRMEQERDASARAWELNVTAGYAYGIVRSTFGVKFTADAAEPS
jgi:hypothetical protein